jgi:endonuclease V-like protein UPF0215 family
MSHIHLEKKGLRGLAIAESFKQGDKKSRLAGIVMRRDFVIDGFVFDKCTVEGDDATDSILKMYSKLGRGDIRFVLISGLIIAMYNIIDIARVQKEIGLPVIGVTYEESTGIEDAIKHHFPDSYKSKIEKYCKLGKRSKIRLHTGQNLYIRTKGCTSKEAQKLLDLFTLQGSTPEPLRVAQLLAKSL